MMTIHSKLKETLIQAVKRAQNNADSMVKIITLNFQGVTSLVYPNDNYQALKHIKMGLLTREIELLSSKLA